MSFNQAHVNSAGTDTLACLPNGFKSGMSFASGADTELPILITPASLRSKYIYMDCMCIFWTEVVQLTQTFLRIKKKKDDCLIKICQLPAVVIQDEQTEGWPCGRRFIRVKLLSVFVGCSGCLCLCVVNFSPTRAFSRAL